MSHPVLDPASGSRMFYFDKTDDRVEFGDIRSESHILVDGRKLEVRPDVVMDFRALPYPAETFRVVVFDPPHLVRVGENAWMGKKYGRLNKETWADDLTAGFAECFRVLMPNGVLIFKWNETQIPVREILALTPHKPLVGHRSGKTARTHWVTFLKPDTIEVGSRVICARPDHFLREYHNVTPSTVGTVIRMSRLSDDDKGVLVDFGDGQEVRCDLRELTLFGGVV